MPGGKVGWREPFALSLAVFAASGLAGPAHAGAVEASTGGGSPGLTFTAEPGEANRLVIVKGANLYTVIDLGAPLTALGSCVAMGTHEATCPIGGPITVALGDLDDTAVVAAKRPVLARGGQGADTITVESDRTRCCAFVDDKNRLVGGAGDDRLRSGLGTFRTYRLEGGAGADVLDGRQGQANLSGGLGADTFLPGNRSTVSYAERTSGVVVDADGNADDGELGENDNVLPARSNVRDVAIDGGSGDDRLHTGGGVNELVGWDGDDVLDARGGLSAFAYGKKGDDVLLGGAKSDSLEGGAGQDTLKGGLGGDDLRGGGGADLIVGGSGRDWAFGDPGDDTLRMRDGYRDRVTGGRDLDRARIDRRLDRLHSIERLL